MLLPNGEVLVVGGFTNGFTFSLTASAEVFDPAFATWSQTEPLSAPRQGSAIALLPNGKVLVSGGGGTNGDFATSELYDVGLGFSAAWQPEVGGLTSPLNLGSGLGLSGSKFRGVTEASGGCDFQNSSSDCPVVQLRSINSGQTVFLSSTNWSTNAYVSLPVTNFPPGYALATIYVNGIYSAASILLLAPTPTSIRLVNVARLPNGAFQFGFTNPPGAVFTALATTDLSLGPSGWSVLGGATEISDGHFQFTDTQATSYPRRFYQVRSP
jgi:hypothetical protein